MLLGFAKIAYHRAWNIKFIYWNQFILIKSQYILSLLLYCIHNIGKFIRLSNVSKFLKILKYIIVEDW